MVKNILSILWKDTCSVTVRRKEKLPDKSTGFREETIIKDAPCKISFFNNLSVSGPVRNDQTASATVQTVKLFCAADLDIPPGSRIEITHNGRTALYTYNGVPSVFTEHQEITLDVWQRWA